MTARGWHWTAIAGLAVSGWLAALVILLRVELAEATLALEDATAYVAQMSAELHLTRRDADVLVDTLAILRADDLTRIDLRGLGGAAAAEGRIFVSRRGILFHAERLPALDATRAYQVWLRAEESGPASAGTLAVNAFGMATLSGGLPAGMSSVAAVTVTVEPAAESTEPTTSPVLAGRRPQD